MSRSKRRRRPTNNSRREFLLAAAGSLGAVATVPGATAPASETKRAAAESMITPERKAEVLVCRVTCGDFSDEDSAAVMMALEDLKTYWGKTFGASSFLLEDEAPEQKADIELLIGAAENLPRIRTLVSEGKIEDLQPSAEGFALDILKVGRKRTAVLRAADRLGLQYSVYCFAEQFLGVRFVHPLKDFLPDKPLLPTDLHIVESPSVPLRALTEGGHVAIGINDWMDIGAWRREDWGGDSEHMRQFVGWGVKNRVNMVMFDDTMGVGAKAKIKPYFVVSDTLWRYLDARGLKTMMYCGPGYAWGALEGAYSKDILCDHNAPRVGPWDHHLCANKPGLVEEADDWLDLLTPHAHHLVGIVTNWQENVCGEGVTEGAEDGVIHRSGDQDDPYDMNSAWFRKPILSAGVSCTSCGHMANVDKWVKYVDYLNTKVSSRRLPPPGIMRTYWGVADPDDGMVAERVVPHLPPGSLSNVACLPSIHRAERVEAWPRIMDEVNGADNGDRRIMPYRELFYGCGSDVPIFPFTTLDRIDDDFRVFGKYRSFAGMLGGVFVYHSMGWLLPLYSMRKQWQAGLEWKSWFRNYFRSLLSDRFTEAFLEISAKIQDVQMIEGLEPGEEPGGYYSRWLLDFHKLTPETLPVGPLKPDDSQPHLRLVKTGSADERGVYTSERVAPALKRIVSLRSKIENTIEKIGALGDALPGETDRRAWNELILLPLRVTATFLWSRILLAQSYPTYIRMREGVLKGDDVSAVAKEGEALCRQALGAQDEYIRLRPGGPWNMYPQDFRPDTVRTMMSWWQRLPKDPQRCRALDICQFLDRAEAETTT